MSGGGGGDPVLLGSQGLLLLFPQELLHVPQPRSHDAGDENWRSVGEGRAGRKKTAEEEVRESGHERYSRSGSRGWGDHLRQFRSYLCQPQFLQPNPPHT
ncbi:unnamed protein product [Spirodela intermedia]|uniref:Uncharacterized protein n=1 Tax=Spirodela intermedia TaxID=51605 RepID=A0A7I8JEK7_SPIIN|nr:unnamed protein product [Spirodela intermedia]CAA6667963.1 unnamed protein product [Spirodela intermedia]